jgi:phosphoglycerate dehydrogenase-like enzyme
MPGATAHCPQRKTMKIAILDDYQNVALRMADWSPVARRAEITVFNNHVSDPKELVKRLLPFDVICVMRERTPLSREVIERLPQLKLIASTGSRNASIDVVAAEERGIRITATGYRSTPTIEMTWALILASERHIVQENNSVRTGGWQTSIGREVDGKVLGVLGLGNIGGQVARIGHAFGMQVIAWSQNLTAEIAAASGATRVSKDELFRRADIVTIHLILSDRTRGLVGAHEIALMRSTSRLINTSRGPIVDEASLIEALQSRSIAGAALDVFDREPLPPDHPFRHLDNVLATPHIGYVGENLYRTFYGDAAAAIAEWLDAPSKHPSPVA